MEQELCDLLFLHHIACIPIVICIWYTLWLWTCIVLNFASIFLYSLIAFDETVTFWLQRVQSLLCVYAYDALFARKACV